MCHYTEPINLNGGGISSGVLLRYVTAETFTIEEVEGKKCIIAGAGVRYTYDFIDNFNVLDGMIRLAQSDMSDVEILRFFTRYKTMPARFHSLSSIETKGNHMTLTAHEGIYIYLVEDFIKHVHIVFGMAKALKDKDIPKAYQYNGSFNFKTVLKKTNTGRWFLTPETDDLFRALEYQMLASNLNGNNSGILRLCANCGIYFMVRDSNDGSNRSRRPRNIKDSGIDPTFCSDRCRVAYNRKKTRGEGDGKEK